jgi:hypothetical protein
VRALVCLLLLLPAAAMAAGPDLAHMLYADRPPVDWGAGNGYFALAGLGAPEGEADPYAWGRARALRYAHEQEQRKRDAGLDAALIPDLPPYDWEADPGAPDGAITHIALDVEGLGDLGCLDRREPLPEPRGGVCATPESLRAAIARNAVLWARFEGLAAYDAFAPTLDITGSYNGRDVITLARMKAAQIVVLAQEGRGEEAYQVWAAQAPVYRAMVGAPTTLVEKAIWMVAYGLHRQALERLLYHAPEVAAAHRAELHALLTPSDAQSLFRSAFAFADELAAMTPYFFLILEEYDLPRPLVAERSMALCLQELEALGRVPAHAFPFADVGDFMCESLRGTPADESGGFLYAWKLIGSAGGTATNTIAYMVYGGMLQGVQFLKNMHLHDARARMARLAVEILARGVADADIPAFAAAAPAALQNPITRAPFGWDPERRVLYFAYPGLPVPKEAGPDCSVGDDRYDRVMLPLPPGG